MVAPQRLVPVVLVQTAPSLPATDAGWTTQRWVRAVSGSGGSNQALGEWTLVQDFGVVKPQFGSEFVSAGIAPDITRAGLVDDLVGVVVRLLKSDDDGTVTVSGATYTPFWWGVIQTQSIAPDLAPDRNTGGRVTWLAVGLACVLDGIHLTRGWVQSSSGSAVDPGFLPPFNAQPGGDRSASTVSVNGSSVYIHQLGDIDSAHPWTAAQIMALLLAGAGQPTLAGGAGPYGWAWALTVVDGCLDYEPEGIDLGGLTLLQAIDQLASTRRALVWTLSVSGSTATITVQSASPDAIPVTGYTLPATTNTATLDVTDPDVAPWIADLILEQDESSTYDAVEVRGAHPWTGFTIGYPDQMQKGWAAASETSWARFPSYPLYESVWRRFLLKAAWDETGNFGAGGMTNTPATATSAEAGVGGLTGARSATASGDRLTGYVHPGESMLPCGELFSASALGPRQAPVVVVFNGTNLYEDMSLKWRVEIQNDPFAVVIDDGKNGGEIAARLAASGAAIYVTVGMREHRPLAVSWQRSPGEFPRATPRLKLISVPTCELWTVNAGAVTGVSGDKVRGAVGTSMTQTVSPLTARNDLAKLQAILALARAWFTVPAYRVRWTDRGTLDIGATYAPGTLLTSVTLGDRTYGTYALITRRTWQLVVRDNVEMWDTVYETQRVLPELEVVL